MLRPYSRNSDLTHADAGDAAAPSISFEAVPDDALTLDIRGGQVVVDRRTGSILRATGANGVEFIGGSASRGLLRLSAPMAEYPSHYVELGIHGAPEVEVDADGIRMTYQRLKSRHADLDIQVEVTLRPRPEGLVLRARVINNSALRLPQVAFPQLLGLLPVGDRNATRIRMSRGTVHPLRDITMRPDDATFLDIPLQRYYGYGAFEFSMKWIDYGSAAGGLTLYGRDPRYATQALLVERPGRTAETVETRWIHMPLIDPGETWDSGDFVLLMHEGDWHAGARAFAEFARPAYPYNAPQPIREALAIRSIWAAVRNADAPDGGIGRIADYAQELTDKDLGVAELVVWHWWRKNGLPILLDPRMGTEDDLAAALDKCREMGVPVSLFVSHHLLRDSDETPPEWRHLNAALQAVQDDWTYGRDFLPRWRVPFVGTHAMMRGSALAPGWREEALREYSHLLDLGATSICFDQFWSWFEPNFSPNRDARADAEGDRLLEFGRTAQEMIRQRNPLGTFSGEMPSEMKVPVLDYTWEWRNAEELDDDAPFRVVFPQVRLNANVNEHPRGALYGFAEGGLINLMPGNMHSFKLADCQDLVETVKQLAALRRRFLDYFTEGEFRHVEGVTVEKGMARAYSLGEKVLLVVANPGDTAVQATVSVDPTSWGGSPEPRMARLFNQKGEELPSAVHGPFTVDLEPDTLAVLELVPH